MSEESIETSFTLDNSFALKIIYYYGEITIKFDGIKEYSTSFIQRNYI